QGSVEVVVFPRLYEQTGPIWRDGSILLVAGRVDHRGEEVSLLADIVVPWDDAVARGPEAFAREVAAGDRGAPRRRQPVPVGPGSGQAPGLAQTPGLAPGATTPMVARSIAGNGYGNGNGNGNGSGSGAAVGARGAPPLDLRSAGR